MIQIPAQLQLINPVSGEVDFILSKLVNPCFTEPERSRNYYAIWIDKGKGKLKYELKEYSFEGPCLLFFSLYQPFVFVDCSEIEGFELQFATDFYCIYHHHQHVACDGILFANPYESPIIMLQPDLKKEMEAVILKMIKEFDLTPIDGDMLFTLLKLFLKLATKVKIEQYKSEPQIEQTTPVLHKLKLLIEQHYKEIKSPSLYAEMLCISAKALSKLSKDYFGKTLTDLIQERVIYEAKRELYFTEKPIKEISIGLGYVDPYYFSRVFKNVCSVSPEFYRQNILISTSGRNFIH